MKDRFHRQIDYLRISVTDRCNFKCRYCFPDGGPKLSAQSDILSYEEIIRAAQSAIKMGIDKFRITGGEPLLRKNILDFVGQLIKLPGTRKVSLTTNGYLLGDYAEALGRLNLHGINIGLNSLKPDVFHSITGVNGIKRVWDGISKLLETGIRNIKINTVLLKGINEDEVIDFARLTIKHPLTVRFIEYMPCGKWEEKQEDIVRVGAIKKIITEELGGLKPVQPDISNGPAQYFRLDDGKG
ncbi:MAG: radical SAM protein, partial [Planctomycetota bacterium]